jgi:hypothetical protein
VIWTNLLLTNFEPAEIELYSPLIQSSQPADQERNRQGESIEFLRIDLQRKLPQTFNSKIFALTNSVRRLIFN